ILLSSPLPSIGHAYSLVIQDEKQREIHATPAYPGETASFIAANQGTGGRRINDYKTQKTGFDARKNTSICSYCKKPGHTIDKCYRIHGFPTDFKFTKQRKNQGIPQANNAFTMEEEGGKGAENVSEINALTQENVTQLLQLLQQVKLNQQSAGTSDASASVNCAGISKFFNSYACFMNIDNESWIIDSGATEHMTFNKSFFSNFRTLPKPLMV
ncbi:hypothetical protein A4A49_63674, partial [Nicotiana attenuata]